MGVMFVDCVEIFIFSGKGGNGAVSFRREKFVQNGGPDGGDGGDGGDVYFEVDTNTDTLSSFRGKKHYRAQNGIPGESKNRTGARGEDLIIKVPPGTVISDVESGEVLCDMIEQGQRVRVLKGGNGGFGNARFKTSVNQRPDFAKSGQDGMSAHVRLELKLIADVGLVGYPNVGKSTLISSISNARPEIANYEFTTLTPKLGVIDLGDFRSIVMADIPGIIDGASEGKGLGFDFLRHIERTEFLLFVLDCTYRYGLIQQFENLRLELKKFSSVLEARDFGVVISKVDCLEGDEEIKGFFEALRLDRAFDSKFGSDGDLGYYLALQKEVWEQGPDSLETNTTESGKLKFVLPIASATGLNIQALKHFLSNFTKPKY